MKIFYSDKTLAHRPIQELHNGSFAPAAEIPRRAEIIADALGQSETPKDFGWDPIFRTHDGGYVAFLKRAHADWRAAGRSGDAMPYVFPIRRRRPVELSRIDAELGRYSFDCGTPVTEGACQAAYWSAQSALSGAQAIRDGAENAFALCRPPGHHSGQDYMGGYSYLNSAAIAADFLLGKGAKKIAILDVDYHHGNGTQDIFYERSDVLFVSLHADPKTDYPFYWGHADEAGDGPGKGFNVNLPMARGTDWESYRRVLESGLEKISRYEPDYLIISYGADTFIDDPISYFNLTTPDYTAMAKQIAAMGITSLICMEGGYDLPSVGNNVKAFLAGF